MILLSKGGRGWPMKDEYWYRYHDYRVAEYIYDDDSFTSSKTKVVLQEVPVNHYTPKGVWLDWGGPKFVLKDARKRFACPTKEEAMVSFMARKKRQRGILKAQLVHVEDAIEIAKEMSNEDVNQATDI